jgi:hypothetical protein
LHGRIAVGGLGGTFQLPAIPVGIAGRPEPGLLAFRYARHTGENKSENKKLKINYFQKLTMLFHNDLETMDWDEGSIPFTRSNLNLSQ